MVLVGDARGKVAILVDDMADTCGTIVQVPQFCLEYLVLVLVLVFPSLLTTSDTCSIIAHNNSLCLRSWSWLARSRPRPTAQPFWSLPSDVCLGLGLYLGLALLTHYLHN